MDQHNPTQWRQMFDTRRRERPPGEERAQPFDQPDAARQSPPLGGYDDGFDPAQQQAAGSTSPGPLSHEEITDEAAIALALDPAEYKPWVLQRGRSRPAMMLHLRRYEPKSGMWVGWQLAYPHLIAVEYIGDKMLSLDFGSRQFVIKGAGLDELARHLQCGTVLMVQEHSSQTWPKATDAPMIRSICQAGGATP